MNAAITPRLLTDKGSKGPLEHACEVCGEFGSHGWMPPMAYPARWWCNDHKPADFFTRKPS